MDIIFHTLYVTKKIEKKFILSNSQEKVHPYQESRYDQPKSMYSFSWRTLKSI